MPKWILKKYNNKKAYIEEPQQQQHPAFSNMIMFYGHQKRDKKNQKFSNNIMAVPCIMDYVKIK